MLLSSNVLNRVFYSTRGINRKNSDGVGIGSNSELTNPGRMRKKRTNMRSKARRNKESYSMMSGIRSSRV